MKNFPEKENDTFICALLGKTNSGKSVLSRRLMDKVPYQTCLLNCRPSDDSWSATDDENKADDKYKYIKWSDLTNLDLLKPPLSLVVEDCINLSEKQLKMLKENISYNTHHLKVSPQILIFHALTYTNLRRYLPLINGIIISCISTSIPSLKQILGYFDVSPKEKELALTKFKNSCKDDEYNFMYWCNHTQTLTHFEPQDNWWKIPIKANNQVEKNKEKEQNIAQHIALCQDRIKRFFGHSPKINVYIALFDLITDKSLEENNNFLWNLNAIDLSIDLIIKNENKKRKCKISFADYLHGLIEATQPLSPSLNSVHTFLCTYIKFPQILVCNKNVKI